MGRHRFSEIVFIRRPRYILYATGASNCSQKSRLICSFVYYSHGGIGNISEKEMNKIEAALDLEALNNANV